MLDMIIDNDPPIERHISVPRDMSQLSCSSFTAGIVEAVLDGLGFVRFNRPPYEQFVTNHSFLAGSCHGTQYTNISVSNKVNNPYKARQNCPRT